MGRRRASGKKGSAYPPERLPDDWTATTLGQLAAYINGYPFKPEDWGKRGLPIIRIAQMTDPAAGSDRYSGTVSDRYLIDDGDLLFSWSATLMTLIWDRGSAYVNQHLFKVVPQGGTDLSFLHHLLDFKLEALAGQTHGTTMKHIKRSDLLPFQVVIPAAEEQHWIAEILDTLDAAIRRTEKLIAKLQQMKQGLLHDLLTRGIDESGQLRDPELHPEDFKDSAVGRIPSDWTVEPFASRCVSSAFGPRFSSDLYMRDGRVATLRTTDMDDEGNITFQTMPRAAIAPEAMASHLLVPGDLLISRSGTCGIAAVFPGYEMPVVPGAFLIRFRLHDRVFSEFFRRYFNSAVGRPRLERLAVGGVQKNIKGSEVLALGVPVCSRVEAARIVGVVDSVEGSVQEERAELVKLRSLKAGLMDELLTGRVRANKLLEGDVA